MGGALKSIEISGHLSAFLWHLNHSVKVSSLGITGMGIVSLMGLVIVLLTSLVNRLQHERTLLDELFEQTPEAVALVNRDDAVIRVNREFTRLSSFQAAGSNAVARSQTAAFHQARGEIYANILK